MGININFRTGGGVFNLKRLKAKTKTFHMLIRELLFAEDCALVAHTEHDAQCLMDAFAKSASRFGLTISIKKTGVLYQPKPGMTYTEPRLSIGVDTLKATNRFCYLGGTVTNDGAIDEDVASRIGKAPTGGSAQHLPP